MSIQICNPELYAQLPATVFIIWAYIEAYSEIFSQSRTHASLSFLLLSVQVTTEKLIGNSNFKSKGF